MRIPFVHFISQIRSKNIYFKTTIYGIFPFESFLKKIKCKCTHLSYLQTGRLQFFFIDLYQIKRWETDSRCVGRHVSFLLHPFYIITLLNKKVTQSYDVQDLRLLFNHACLNNSKLQILFWQWTETTKNFIIQLLYKFRSKSRLIFKF